MNKLRAFVAVVLMTGLTSCGGKTDSASSAPSGASDAGSPAAAAGGSKVIGVSIQNREAQFYQDMEAGHEVRQAAKDGYTLDRGRCQS